MNQPGTLVSPDHGIVSIELKKRAVGCGCPNWVLRFEDIERVPKQMLAKQHLRTTGW